MDVICCGPQGSFSEEAALTFVTRIRDFSIVFEPDFAAVVKHLFSKTFPNGAVGILPIENSIAGSVNETYDLINYNSLLIQDEIYIPISHHLCGYTSSQDIPHFEQIYSHPMAIAQCQSFLKDLSPLLTKTSCLSTSEAARIVSEIKSSNHAAICSERAANIHGLTLLARDIADIKSNTTRFVVVCPFATNPFSEVELKELDEQLFQDNKTCKWSCLLHLPHTPGSLVTVLKVLEHYNINLTKLESRPLRDGTLFSYRFYVDFEVQGMSVPTSRDLIARINSVTDHFRVLGIYPPSPYPDA